MSDQPVPADLTRRPAAPLSPSRDTDVETADSPTQTYKRSAEADAVQDDQLRKKRAQVSRACDRCRNLRRACSEYRPCKRCVDQGLAERCLGMPGPVQIIDMPWSDSIGESQARMQSLPSYRAQQLANLLPPPVVDHCASCFFEKLYSTIPILTMDKVARLKNENGSTDGELISQGLLASMCALILLQVEEDTDSLFARGLAAENNAYYGRKLFEEAISVHRHAPSKSTPTIDLCLLTFFLYACHAAMLHHSQAFFFLREATTMWLLLRPCQDDIDSTTLSNRLFWVLLISERSHGIRYRRSITLQLTAESPPLAPDHNSMLAGFWSLASLFKPLDASFIAVLNQEETSIQPTPTSFTLIETAVNSALKPTLRLQDTQKANLRVTQLWLRIIIWQLRLRFGHLTEESIQPSLTFRYPLEVAKDLTLSTRDLPLPSIKAHGVGLTEKLFDVASAVVDVLARIPISPSSPQESGVGPEEDLNYLRRLITQLPGGNDIYDALLDKHIQQAVPGMELGLVHNLPSF